MNEEKSIDLIIEEFNKLSKIKRFSKLEIGKDIIINDTVYDHSKRLLYFIIYNENVLKKYFDTNYLKFLAIFHDMPELLTGDISGSEKLFYDTEDKEKLKNKEFSFFINLKNKLGITKIKGYGLDEIFLDLIEKKTKESNFLKLLDIVDGFLYYYFKIYLKYNKLISNGLVPIYNYLGFKDKNIDFYFEKVENHIGVKLFPNKDLVDTILDRFFLNKINDLYYRNTLNSNNFLQGISFILFGFRRKYKKIHQKYFKNAKKINIKEILNSI